jgi:hypothetical protein
MVAHAVFDLTAVTLIYWQWESAVAHLVFRNGSLALVSRPRDFAT